MRSTRTDEKLIFRVSVRPVFIPYSKLSVIEQAVKLLRARQATIPAKHHSAALVLSNAIRYLKNEEIHSDNKGECMRLFKRLKTKG